MARHRPPKTPDLIIGPMPVNAVNKALETELEAGNVILTRGAQRHASHRHPVDYPLCLPHLANIIANPRYIGDDFKNTGIEIWGYAPSLNSLILIAISIKRDAHGNYQISSFYMNSEKKANKRRLAGFLKVAT